MPLLIYACVSFIISKCSLLNITGTIKGLRHSVYLNILSSTSSSASKNTDISKGHTLLVDGGLVSR